MKKHIECRQLLKKNNIIFITTYNKQMINILNSILSYLRDLMINTLLILKKIFTFNILRKYKSLNKISMGEDN